jgi:hypothetical protein
MEDAEGARRRDEMARVRRVSTKVSRGEGEPLIYNRVARRISTDVDSVSNAVLNQLSYKRNNG